MQNVFIGKGNLGDYPNLKRIAKRNKPEEEFVVCSKRVLFARYGIDQATGEVGQIVGFWREVEIYGNKAEACARFLKRGARVLVVGEERDFYAKDEDGNEVQVVKVVAEDVALQLTRIDSIVFKQSNRREDAMPPEGTEQHAISEDLSM